MNWPCNSSELTRRLGWSTRPGEGYVFIVRDVLVAHDCPKAGPYPQSHWIVSEAMGEIVSRETGRPLR